MPRRKFQLTQQQEEELQTAFLQCTDGRTQLRYQAVLLYGRGYTLKNVIQITGCSRSSLMDWCNGYQQLGVEGLVDQRGRGNHRKLSEAQTRELSELLQGNRPSALLGKEAGPSWNVKTLEALVELRFGVKYKRRDSYHGLFKKCGFFFDKKHQAYVFEQTVEQKKAWDIPEIVNYRKSG